MQALYWSKTAEWFAVDAALEATAFLDGVPKGAQALRLVLGAGGGFEATGGRFSKQKATDIDVAVVCCHGGPGEDGTLQAALDGAGHRLHRARRGGGGARAWTSWRSGA